MKSLSNHTFAQVPGADIASSRSVFDRSHGHKTCFNEGYLIPFYADEALPGDTFRANATIFARLATPIVPIMDNIHMETFYFAVPIRLVWDNFKKFMGEQTNPGDSTSFILPQISSFTVLEGSLSDHLGLPLGALLGADGSTAGITSVYHRAYNLIYNEWFRDQNMINSVSVPKTDGPDNISNFTLLKRGKRHDYFTSALPWPQKGTAVNLPLGTSAKIVGTGEGVRFYDGTNYQYIASINTTSGAASFAGTGSVRAVGYGTSGAYGTGAQDKVMGMHPTDNHSGLIADLSSATAATINSLRQAFQLQRLYERDARGGTRYTEIIRSHFGVISPDARLQRPEYLGGSSTRININPVQQTSATAGGSTPQGNLAGFGVAADGKGGFTKSFTEHTIVLGLVCVRSDLTYQQGVPRKFMRQTRFDFYWPALAHLGEQEIWNKEIYNLGDGLSGASNDYGIFGYQERFAEYRYFPSEITSTLRSTSAVPLDVWHLAQKFASLPALGAAFINEPVGVSGDPMYRVLAVPSQPHIIFDSIIELHCARPMPVYSVPGLIDHF